jgi:hypothetical protein
MNQLSKLSIVSFVCGFLFFAGLVLAELGFFSAKVNDMIGSISLFLVLVSVVSGLISSRLSQNLEGGKWFAIISFVFGFAFVTGSVVYFASDLYDLLGYDAERTLFGISAFSGFIGMLFGLIAMFFIRKDPLSRWKWFAGFGILSPVLVILFFLLLGSMSPV